MAEVHGTCEPRFDAVRRDARRPDRHRSRHRRLRRRVPARRAGGRHLGRLGRRGEDAAVGARHHHQRLVDHQDHDVPRRPHAARPRRARLPRARDHLLARVRRRRQGEDRGAPHHGAHVRAERMGGAPGRRGPRQLGPLHVPAGRAGAVVGARHRLGLPRPDAGLPHRRDRPPHHRREHRQLRSPARWPSPSKRTSTSACRRARTTASPTSSRRRPSTSRPWRARSPSS